MSLPLKGKSFLVVGRAGLDLYADPPGTRIEDATSFSAALGGSAANIAVALVRQGCEAALVTAVSDDAVGRYTLKALRGYGVSTTFVSCVGGEARNSLAVVETRAENCQSVIYRNGAADFELGPASVATIDYRQFAAVILTGTCLAQEPSRATTLMMMHFARKAKVPLIMDVDYRPYSWASPQDAGEVCLKAAKACDMIVANDEEFAVLAGGRDGFALAQALAAQAGRVVAYKRGGAGCTMLSGTQQIDVPIFPVTALKPTGAGDAFMGGLLAGLVDGASLQEAARRGAATAALVVTRVGCAPAMPQTVEVQRLMQSASAEGTPHAYSTP